MAISPDGKNLYLPQLEGAAWQVVNAASGDVITTIETKSGSHNTIYSADGSHVYLAGLNSKLLFRGRHKDEHDRAYRGALR